MKRITWMTLGCISLVTTTALAADVNCVNPTSNIEQLICRDVELLHLDNDLDKSYQRALSLRKDPQSLINEQNNWLKAVYNTCMDSICLKGLYKSRIIDLITSSRESNLPQSEKEQNLVPFKVDMPTVCGFLNANLPEDAVVLGAGGSQGKATAFQIDQSGHSATRIDVAVNYPGKPVALMLGAYEPTIWNIGWTAGTNIVAVFASGHHRQRVAGLKAGIPILIDTVQDNGPCSHSTQIYLRLKLTESLVANFGHGTITNAEEARVEQGLSQILYSRPISKIFSVNEKDGNVVIGGPLGVSQQLLTSPVTPPESFYDKTAPLAGEAGLRSAMKKGILRRATLKDSARWIRLLKKKYALQHLPPPDIPPDLENAYVILKEFTYPLGLYGGDSATFYIPEGVPRPTGNYGHSKIYDFNSISLECVAGSACGQAIMGGAIGAGSTQQIMIINSGN